MSGSTQTTFPVANFPAVGPVGGFYQFGPAGGIMQVAGDGGGWVSGPWIISVLAEMRVQTQILYQLLGTETTSLQQMRADAVTDMGTLYSTTLATPVPSS
jgi:hypothetical protein